MRLPATFTVQIIEDLRGVRIVPADTAQPSLIPVLGERERSEIERLSEEVDRAERRYDPIATREARRNLGDLLFRLLDGPGRILRSALDAAPAGRLDIEIVLHREFGDPAAHPALGWRFELLHDDAPVFEKVGRSLVVQVGRTRDPEETRPHPVRVLFMAYSPHDVQPGLDFEREEEELLQELSDFVRDGHAWVQVVEDGTLAALRDALKRDAFDVVYLSGHGQIGPNGPVLLFEDEFGQRRDCTPAELLEALHDAKQMPEVVLTASCFTAQMKLGAPSFAASLLAGGVPAAVAWAQPVGDRTARVADVDVIVRLCQGKSLRAAVAECRQKLYRQEARYPDRLLSSGTLTLLSRTAARVRFDEQLPRPPAPERQTSKETYRYLDATGRMRVLETGFVGRRRELQRLVRVLHSGKVDGRLVAGTLVYGNKGEGKREKAALSPAPWLVTRHLLRVPPSALYMAS